MKIYFRFTDGNMYFMDNGLLMALPMRSGKSNEVIDIDEEKYEATELSEAEQKEIVDILS